MCELEMEKEKLQEKIDELESEIEALQAEISEKEESK
jgi:prefoldin subunit 5